MSDQYSMFDPTISEDMPSAISSPESASGATPCALPDGQTARKPGPAPAHASPSARQAKAKRSTMKGIFGQSSFDSSKHEDLSFVLASRLRPLTDSLGSTLFSLTWMTRVTPAGRSISALRASEPAIEDSVCTGWPTPQKHDERERGNTMADCHYFPHDLSNAAILAGWPTPVANDDNKTPEAHLAMKQRMGERDGTRANRTAITSLQVMAQLSGWPTTRAEDAESSGMRHGRGVADTMTAVASLAGWKTPTACSPNSLRGQGQEPEIREAGGHAVNLQDQVRLAGWKTPCVPNGGRISGNQTDIGKHQDGTKAQISSETEAKLSGWATPKIASGDYQYSGPDHEKILNLQGQARLTAFGDQPIGYLLGRNGWEIVPACGQLNPAHSRWLMGLPEIWDRAAIAAFRWLKKRKREP